MKEKNDSSMEKESPEKEKEQLIRYSNLDFIGPLSLEIVLNGSNYVIDAKRLEISAVEMKCP